MGLWELMTHICVIGWLRVKGKVGNEATAAMVRGSHDCLQWNPVIGHTPLS